MLCRSGRHFFLSLDYFLSSRRLVLVFALPSSLALPLSAFPFGPVF